MIEIFHDDLNFEKLSHNKNLTKEYIENNPHKNWNYATILIKNRKLFSSLNNKKIKFSELFKHNNGSNIYSLDFTLSNDVIFDKGYDITNYNHFYFDEMDELEMYNLLNLIETKNKYEKLLEIIDKNMNIIDFWDWEIISRSNFLKMDHIKKYPHFKWIFSKIKILSLDFILKNSHLISNVGNILMNSFTDQKIIFHERKKDRNNFKNLYKEKSFNSFNKVIGCDDLFRYILEFL